AFDIADEHARAAPQRRGLVGVRIRIAAVEPAVSGRRDAAGVAARIASPLLPLVARFARHAHEARTRTGTRSRRHVPWRCTALAGAARARRIASALAARNGRRRLRAALGATLR